MSQLTEDMYALLEGKDTRSRKEARADDLAELKSWGYKLKAERTKMGWFIKSTGKRIPKFNASGPFKTKEIALDVGIMRAHGDTRPVDDILDTL